MLIVPIVVLSSIRVPSAPFIRRAERDRGTQVRRRRATATRTTTPAPAAL
jgi:hypothetical protein